MSWVLGIDASTQSTSGMILDVVRGEIVADVSVNYGKELPQYDAPQGFVRGEAPGEVHADPRMWLDALDLLLARLAEAHDLSQVVAISGAGQQHGSVYLNEAWERALAGLTPSSSLRNQLAKTFARPTAPIWMDTSTAAECREIADAVGGDAVVRARTGSIAIERFTGPQIRRFAKIDPTAYAATQRIHLVSSFHASVLAGKDAPIDTGDGAGMNLVRLDEWDWDADLLAATAPSLRDRLPPVVPGNTLVGHVAPYFQARYGFAAETPVIAFTGDNPSSLVGMGASQPGKVVISLGTSDTFFAAMPGAPTDPDGFGHVFGNPLGGTMALQCFVNGSLAREQVKDRFGLDWDAFSAALAHTPPGNDGNQMVPFFDPEISPRVTLSGPALRGSDDFVAWADAEAAVRACVEGQFLNMAARSAWMGLDTETLYLTGGAAQNDALAQVVANVFDVTVERLATGSSVALGAAMRAATWYGTVSLAELEQTFCQPEDGKRVAPELAAVAAYQQALPGFAEWTTDLAEKI